MDYVAKNHTGEALARELRGALAGSRVLLPRSDRADDRLPARCAKPARRSPKWWPIARSPRMRSIRICWSAFATPKWTRLFSPVRPRFTISRWLLGAAELAALSERVQFAAIGPTTARAMRERRRARRNRSRPKRRRRRSPIAIANYYQRGAASHRSEARVTFPVQRPRRLRRTEAMREHGARDAADHQRLRLSDVRVPGQRRCAPKSARCRACTSSRRTKSWRSAAKSPISAFPAVILFGLPEHKDATGSEAAAADGAVQRAIEADPQGQARICVVITDVCLCEYTSHGHCGVIEGRRSGQRSHARVCWPKRRFRTRAPAPTSSRRRT